MEKVNISINFCIFKLVYSWVLLNLIAGVGGVEEILFDTLKWNAKKLECFELQMIGKTDQVHH